MVKLGALGMILRNGGHREYISLALLQTNFLPRLDKSQKNIPNDFTKWVTPNYSPLPSPSLT